MATWLLEAGEYADREIVAVLVGTKREAEKAAQVLTERRAMVGRSSDMVQVRVEHVDRVDQHGKVVR